MNKKGNKNTNWKKIRIINKINTFIIIFRKMAGNQVNPNLEGIHRFTVRNGIMLCGIDNESQFQGLIQCSNARQELQEP